MGGKSSKSEAIVLAEQLFNEYEKQQIGSIFQRLCKGGKNYFTEKELGDFVEGLLPDSLVERLHQFMCQALAQEDKMVRPKNDRGSISGVYADDFLVAIAHMLKGSPGEKARMVCCLSTGQLGDQVMAVEAARLLEHMLQAYIACLQENPEFQSWQLPEDEKDASTRFAKYLGHDLFFKGKSQASAMSSTATQTALYTDEDIEKWITQCPIFLHMLDTVFYTVFPVLFTEGESLQLKSVIPTAEGADWSKFLTVLDLPSILTINYSIPHELRHMWRFLFSTNVHGSSFSTMSTHIAHQGPTLIIIRDTDGHVFGGYAANSWEPCGNYYGINQCFLFSLNPSMNVFPVSGYNSNYQYYNHGQETIPNGLGFGGQFDYFGLWIDAEFGQGHSRAQPKCITYNSPRLSSQENFQIDYIEVWGIGPKPKPQGVDEDGEPVPGSILDKDPEAKAMLALINRGPVSEGLREEDPEADMPGEHGAGSPGGHGEPGEGRLSLSM